MSFDESQAVNDNLCKKKPGTLKGRWESAIDRSKSIESTKVDAVKNNTLSQFRSNSGTGIVKSRVDAIKFIIQSPNPDAVLDATVLASRAMVKQRLIDSYTRHQRKLAKQKMDAITWDSINQSISTVSNPPVSSLSDMRPLDKYKKPLRVAKEMTANESLQPLEHTHVSASHMIDIETRTNAVEDVLRGDGATAQVSSCKEDEYDSEEECMVIDEDGLNIYQSGCTRLYSMNQLRLLLSTTGSSAKTEYELFEFLKSKNHEVDVPLLFACGVSDADSGLSRSGVDVEHVLVDIVALVLTVESNTFVAITITCKYRDDCPVKRVKRRIALLDPSNNNVLLEMDVVVTGGIVAFPQISPEHVDQESDSDDESSGSEDGSAFSGEPDVKSDEKVALTNTSEPQIESVIADDLVCNVPLRPRSPTVIPISERSTTTDASLQWFPPARASSAPSTPSKREVPPTGEAVATLDAHSSSLLSPAPISARTAARLARLSISPSTGKFMPTPSPQLPSAPAPHPSAVVEVDDVEFDGTPVEYSKHSTVIENSGDVGLFDSLDDIIGMTCSDTHLVVQYSSKGQHRVIVVKYCRSGNESVLKSCVLNYDSVMIVRGSRLVEYVRRSCMSGWMTKWPMNSSIGASTHRYFTLLGSELSYYKLPPDGHEVQITSLSPYVANPNSKHFASNDDSNTLKTVQLLRNTVVSKQTTQLFKPCYCLETSGGTIRMIAEEEEDNQAWVDAIEYNSRYLQQQEKLEQSSVYAPLKTSAPDVGTRIESIEHTKHEYFHHDTGHYRCVCIDVCGDVHCGVYEYLHKGDVQYCLEYSQIGTKSPSTTRFQISCVHKTNSNLDCKLLQLCMYSEDIVIVGGEHGYVALGQVNTYFQSKDQLSLPCLSLLPPGDSASSGNNGNLGSVSAISVCRERHLFVVGDAKGGFALYRVGEVPATASLSYRLQSQFNVNTLKDNSKKRYGPRLFMEESDSDSIVALQFVYRGLYVLVTTSSGRVLLIGLSFEAGEDLTSDAGASRDISVTTWSTVDLFSLSASTSSGPPRGLAAMAMPRGSNGVGIAGGNNCDSRIRYIMSIEPYQEMDDVTSDMHTRQRIILYKIFVSATMEGHVECVRQAISEAVLQKAIAKSECLLV